MSPKPNGFDREPDRHRERGYSAGVGRRQRADGRLRKDVLWGMGGADRFVYTSYDDSLLATGYDEIADLSRASARSTSRR